MNLYGIIIWLVYNTHLYPNPAFTTSLPKWRSRSPFTCIKRNFLILLILSFSL